MVTKNFKARAFGDEEYIQDGITKIDQLLKEKFEQIESLNYQNWKVPNLFCRTSYITPFLAGV